MLVFFINLIGGFWRLKDLCNNHPNKYMRYLLKRIYMNYVSREGSYIAYSSRFEGPAIFPHGMKGIFISRKAFIGKNAIIFHQVTIGSNALPDSSGLGAPTIGNNVYIGAGAKIIGSVNVGNNCRIGANAVVVTDVPDNCVVVMNRPNVIQKDKIDNRFYSRPGTGWVYYEDGKPVRVKDTSLIEHLYQQM